MHKGLVVIPFNVSWHWSTDYLNQTAFELEKRGYIVVCYLKGDTVLFKDVFTKNKIPKILSRFSKNIYLITPFDYLPFRRFKIVRDLNSTINRFILRLVSNHLSSKRNLKTKIFWIFDPNLIFIFNKFPQDFVLLYDCVDFFAIGDPENVRLTNKNEKYLCKKADIVVANSHVLQSHLMKYRANVMLVPQGFRVNDFKTNNTNKRNLHLKKPVVGFVGAVNYRLDYDLLIKLSQRNPNWTFVIWGPVLEKEKIDAATLNKMNTLLGMKNVVSGKSDDKSEIPGIISQFDVATIPYDMTQDFNKNCHPMKLFEYLYLCKPVVSTPIRELKYFTDFVYLESTALGFENAIKKILKHPINLRTKEKMIEVSNENSWQEKVGQIISFLPEIEPNP